MIVEHRGILPQDNRRFKCKECGSQFIAEGEGQEWFIKPGKYVGTEQYIAYCPICVHEVREYNES